MAKLRILVADDEPLARARVCSFLRTDSSVEVIGECSNGDEVLAAIRSERPDVVFLDVQMPGRDGLKVLEELPDESRPAIVLVTAHDRFAVDAFDARVTDYLLKPFDRTRFAAALERASEHITNRKARDLAAKVEGLLTSAAPAQPERISVKHDGRVVFLKAAEIVWVEAANNYSTLHLAAAKRLLVREPLSSLEKRLGPVFARVNRSALVHMDQVHELQPSKYGDYTVVLREGTRLPLSRNLRGRLRNFITNEP